MSSDAHPNVPASTLEMSSADDRHRAAALQALEEARVALGNGVGQELAALTTYLDVIEQKVSSADAELRHVVRDARRSAEDAREQARAQQQKLRHAARGLQA